MKSLLNAVCLLLSFSAATQADWKKHVIVPRQPGGINSVVASDWNGDGLKDVLASYGGHVVLHLAPDWNPHRVFTFQRGLSRNHPRSACIHSCLMDVDGDGDQDLVGSNNTVFWLECPADPLKGEWIYRTVDDEILGTHCLITGDVDRDGKLDLIANSGRTAPSTKFPNSIAWLSIPQNPKEAKSWNRHVFAQGDAPGGSHYMGLGDVNGDGLPDIACGAKGGENFPGGEWFAWWEQPKSGKLPWTKHLLSDKEPGASNIIPADVDRDGHMDYLATRGHGKGVLWFKGLGFEKIEIDPEMIYPHSLAVADMDGDGDIDLATCGKEADGVVASYENDGKGAFTKHVIDRGQGSYDLRLEDMDGDGDLDILIAGHASNNVVWYEMSF